MKFIKKSAEEIELIRQGGHILAEVTDKVIAMVKPGVTTQELDEYAEKLMREAGGEPAFKGYAPSFADEAYPSTLCLSINDEIVHAPPLPSRVLAEGDILGIDIGLKYKGMFTDMARTVPVGNISKEARELLLATEEALAAAIASVAVDKSFYGIGQAVEAVADKYGYGVVRDLVGHGVGVKIHEEPNVPNFKDKSVKKNLFVPGMVLALEPMLTGGSYEVELLENGWTYSTADGSLAAQFENTIAINYDGTIEILTPTTWRVQ